MTKEQEEKFLDYCNGLSAEELENLYNYLLCRILIKKFSKVFFDSLRKNEEYSRPKD